MWHFSHSLLDANASRHIVCDASSNHHYYRTNRSEHNFKMFINLYVEIDAIWCIQDMQSIVHHICWWHISKTHIKDRKKTSSTNCTINDRLLWAHNYIYIHYIWWFCAGPASWTHCNNDSFFAVHSHSHRYDRNLCLLSPVLSICAYNTSHCNVIVKRFDWSNSCIGVHIEFEKKRIANKKHRRAEKKKIAKLNIVFTVF